MTLTDHGTPSPSGPRPWWEQTAPPAAPAPAAPSGLRRRTVALFAAATLAAGATGAGTTLLLTGDDTRPAATATAAAVLRDTAAAPAAAAGSAEAAAATISPSVVTIAFTGTTTATGLGGRSATQQVSGTGSGVVLKPDGYILTNNHVVAAAVSGGTVSVTFSDGRTVAATIVGTDPSSDLAVIKADATGLTPAVFADSDALAVGQSVLAVGAPLGLSNTVTEGIVSTLHRPVRTGESADEQSVLDAVQTDAAINPGNSGGALVDLAGRVVGINSAIASTTDTSTGAQAGNIGVGFAIPSNAAAEVADEIVRDGRATHPQLGVGVADAQSAQLGTPGAGAELTAVTAGGPAAQAGLQAGDVVTKVGDRTVTDADGLIVAVREHNPGDSVAVTYERGGSTSTAQVVLGTAPAS